MRIACCIHGLDGGGAERLMAGLASRLAGRHQIDLITWTRPESDRYPLDPRIERIGLDLRHDSRHFAEGFWRTGQRVQSLRRAIRRTRAELVLSFCDQMNVLACLASPVPVIVSEHTDPRHQPLSRSWRWARTKLYRRAAAGIGLTEGAAAAIRRWIPHAPIVVIPPAIDPPSGGWHDGGRNDGPPWTLAAVGRLSPEKGIDRLISAFAKSQAPHRGWRLQLAGDGPERTRLAEQAAQLQCSHAIEFLGWQADVWAVLARAHALVLSSHYEGFPLALLEGMAAGLPCLSVDCPSGPRELITDNATGLLVPSSIEGLRGGIDQLVNDAGLRDRLGRAARAVRTRYTWERFVTAHESLCEQSLERSLG